MPKIFQVVKKASGDALVAWGPDFGEGSDDNTWTVGLRQQPLDTVTLENERTVGLHMDGALDIPFPAQTVGMHVSGEVLGAPFWQSVSTTRINNVVGDTQMTLTKPTGTVQGDLLLAFFTFNNNPAPAVTAPTGWTEIRQDGFCRSFWKLAGASEAADYQFTFTAELLGCAEMHRINGVHQTTPINAHNGGTATVTDPVVVAVTTTVANCLVFCLVGHSHLASENHTAPASHVERTEQTDGAAGVQRNQSSYTRVFAPAAATGTATVDCSLLGGQGVSYQRIAIAPGVLVLAP